MTPTPTADSACWRSIGVHGDGSCPELTQYVHCRNCPVHAQAGRSLLDRGPPEGYQESLAESMAAEPAPPVRGTRAVLVFRIGEEWLAIDTPVIREVVPQRPGHSLPHHPESAVQGLVNVRGTLEIAVSLEILMGLQAAAPAQTVAESKQRTVMSRTLVLSQQGETFACPVNEVAGIIALAPEDIGAVPVTVARAENRHVEGVIATERGPAGLIDPTKLFTELAARVFR